MNSYENRYAKRLYEAQKCMDRLLSTIHEYRKSMDNGREYPSRARIKRASMDVTDALVWLRKPSHKV